jgi:hypothetical protein
MKTVQKKFSETRMVREKQPLPNIVYTRMDIATSGEIVLNFMSDDKILGEAACELRKEIERSGEEQVYYRKCNVLVADSGYIFAIYENQIKK